MRVKKRQYPNPGLEGVVSDISVTKCTGQALHKILIFTTAKKSLEDTTYYYDFPFWELAHYNLLQCKICRSTILLFCFPMEVQIPSFEAPKLTSHCTGGSRGCEGRAPEVQILLISCRFGEILAKSYIALPRV